MYPKSVVVRSLGIAALALVCASSAWAQTFTPTGPLNVPRSAHTATLLNNGQVLIVGGRDAAWTALASAELYDPATGQFAATVGELESARYGHTATLLSDGRVLIAGGYGPSGVLASAELYDPATGQFSFAGTMTAAREGHTATLLPDGKVLIAGGSNGLPPELASAELYDPARDPASGPFTLTTGDMARYRMWHTATLLTSGKVLIAGGWAGVLLTEAELYDPATGLFDVTGSMDAPHYSHTATLLTSGKVLIVDGLSGSEGYLASAELYDPTAGTFSTTGSLPKALTGHTATLLKTGRVLIAGGYGTEVSPEGYYGTADYLADANLYDPVAGQFTPTGSLAWARDGHTGTLLNNGKVLVAGGYNYDDVANVYRFVVTAELFSLPQVPLRITLCHRTGRRYKPITLTMAAERAHRAHGDAAVGEDVPGVPGMVFSPSCQWVSE